MFFIFDDFPASCYFLSPAINPFLYCILSKRFRRGFHDLKRKMNKWFNSSSLQSSSNQESVYVYQAPIQVRSVPNYSSLRYISKKVQTRNALLRHLDLPLPSILNFHTEGPTHNKNDIDMEMTRIVNQTSKLDRNNGMNLAHTVSIHKGTTINSTEWKDVLHKDKRNSENNTKNSSMKENCKYKVIFKNDSNSDTTVIINNTCRKRDYSMKRNFKRFSQFNNLKHIGASSPSLLGNCIQPTLNNGGRFNGNTTGKDTFKSNSFIEKYFGKCVTD